MAWFQDIPRWADEDAGRLPSGAAQASPSPQSWAAWRELYQAQSYANFPSFFGFPSPQRYFSIFLQVSL